MKSFLICSLFVGFLVSSIRLAAPSAADERERERNKGKERDEDRGRAKPNEADKGRARGASIESIMKAVHGKRGLMKSLGILLEAKVIKWDEVQATAKKILPLATDLGKRKPDRGSKESWADLTETYADFAKELADATAKKDLDATKDAFAFLNSATSCTKCHDRHKED